MCALVHLSYQCRALSGMQTGLQINYLLDVLQLVLKHSSSVSFLTMSAIVFCQLSKKAKPNLSEYNTIVLSRQIFFYKLMNRPVRLFVLELQISSPC